jgi:SAM-dependent methyltransferase
MDIATAPRVHEDDHLLNYIIREHGPEVGLRMYFEGGKADAHKIFDMMAAVVNPVGARILDFASGFGRVARHMEQIAPHSQVNASDIHPDACAFINKELGIMAHQSSMVPEDLYVGRNYDFIYVMSLFSHLPAKTFTRWIVALLGSLKPGGHLLFTTHGPAAVERHPEFFGAIYDEATGIGFRSESDQPDIDGSEYGSSVVSVEYVLGMFKREAPGCLLKAYEGGSWLGHQDGWLVRAPL